MTLLVTDSGFIPDDWADGYVPLAALSDTADPTLNVAVDLNSPVLRSREWDRLRAALPRIGLIRIRLRDFGDVEALDLASTLRRHQYGGRLRAHGAMLARCYTLARRAGFDEVELDPAQARRQTCEHWRNEPGWFPRTDRIAGGLRSGA
ncbi:MAG: DUF934 domain-containing protein [Rhodobacteraceae bacterium]|jgi:uncharacterized protein (DUF934 family)|nr:DUF934 domain-containing protein [Paracoccaceae bacterium]